MIKNPVSCVNISYEKDIIEENKFDSSPIVQLKKQKSPEYIPFINQYFVIFPTKI